MNKENLSSESAASNGAVLEFSLFFPMTPFYPGRPLESYTDIVVMDYLITRDPSLVHQSFINRGRVVTRAYWAPNVLRVLRVLRVLSSDVRKGARTTIVPSSRAVLGS